jgi:hypothetical protein
VPASEREAELARMKSLARDGKFANRLEEKVMAEFVGASLCLGGEV